MGDEFTILIVDDMEINRSILGGIFKSDYNILEADSAGKALEILYSGSKVDLIVLDLIMPEMNGMEFLRCVKKDKRFDNIAIVVNTQSGDQENEVEALELGADDFIMKPYNPKIIKRRITNIIEKYIYQKNVMESSLKDAQERIDNLIDTVPGAIVIFEMEDDINISYFSGGLCSITGYTEEEISELDDIFTLVYTSDREIFVRMLENAKNNGIIHCRVRMCHKSGGTVWCGINTKKTITSSGKCRYNMVILDLTEEKKAEQRAERSMLELRYRAEHDTLTGLLSREAFYNEAEKLIEKEDSEYIIGYWNIDRFKVINELFGRDNGDMILSSVAKWIRESIGRNGVCARLEADHFVTCTTKEFIVDNMDKICQFLLGDLKWNSLNYPVLLHVGYYEVEDKNIAVNLMCDRANMALHMIKNNYMVRYNYYNGTLKNNIMAEQEIVNDMNSALAKRQFFVCYQPVVDTITKRTVSAEALVRWKHPERGIISPGLFIPVFEKNGFITKLDMYVCEEVCRHQHEERLKGHKVVPVSVNLSRINFYNNDLHKEILSLLKKYDLTSEDIKLEITESAYQDNPEDLIMAIDTLQRYGFKVLMDDFGSGYSSLNMLKDCPVDILKIDMKFIDDIEYSERASSIVYNIINMAKTLKMETLVEGVETKKQYELLVNMGCDNIQGYYFSKPVSDEEFVNRIIMESVV